MERFDCENLFCAAIQEGISLFCGAGFSVEAKDRKGRNLPVGIGLLDELKLQFPRIKPYSSLPKACTTLKKSDKNSFYNFLEERFTIGDFDVAYDIIPQIKIKNIYTTNIDDLFFKIYSKSDCPYYLNDSSCSGNEIDDSSAVGYFPLHGCVKSRGEYVFGLQILRHHIRNHQKLLHGSNWRKMYLIDLYCFGGGILRILALLRLCMENREMLIQIFKNGCCCINLWKKQLTF